MTRTPFTLPQGDDPCPDLCIELGPDGKGVGNWVPEQKHLLLAKMIGGTRAARAKWSSRVLIDPFCGPGRIRVKGEARTRDGGTLVACRTAEHYGVPFTAALVGDIDPARVHASTARLSAIGVNATGFAGPAASTVLEMVRAVPRGALVLAYIDPYNLEYLSFDIIKALAELPHVDFAVHFSTMDLQRNVDMELDPTRARFDDAAPGWRQALAQQARSGLRVAFFRYWMQLVTDLGFTVSKEMPLVRGDRNEPLYQLVFFSRHPLPNKIWDDVARSPNLDFGF